MAIIPGYRLQQPLTYRHLVEQFSEVPVYRKPWVLGFPESPQLSQPLRKAITVRIYDPGDVLIHNLSSNARDCPILGARFELLDSGCGSFDLELAERLDLVHDSRVDVHLWNDPTAIYSGFLTELPAAGTTEQTFKYGGYGGTEKLGKIYFLQGYSPHNVRTIVVDVMQQIERRNPRLIFSDSQIAACPYDTLGNLKFIRWPAKKVLEELARLAGGYEFGVDSQRRLFFRPPSQDLDFHAWTGKHLETYVPVEDSSKIVNTLYVKCGKVRDDLNEDDPLRKTNWCEGAVEDEGPDRSQLRFGVLEGEFSAPSALDPLDALRSGFVQLQKLKEPRKYAKVKGLVYEGTPIVPGGLARIVGHGGAQLVFPKNKVSYAASGTELTVTGELGDLDYAPANLVASLVAQESSENLLRQQSQTQL